MCSSILKQILRSQETATFSVTDVDMSGLCANGWCQMTTIWTCFVKIARTASVRVIIKPVSFTLKSAYLHLVTKFVIKAESRFEDSNKVHNIRYNSNEWNDSSQTDKDDTSMCKDLCMRQIECKIFFFQ